MKWLLLPLLFLASCANSNQKAEGAENQFRLAVESGTNRDVCMAARRAADAWLERNNREQFEHWRLLRDVHCRTAERDPEGMPSGADEEREARAARSRQHLNEMANSQLPDVREAATDLENWIETGNQSR